MAFDEEESVEVEERVAEGDFAAELAGLVEQLPAGGGVRDGGGGGRFADAAQPRATVGQRRVVLFQVLKQSGCAAQHHIERVAIGAENQGFGAVSFRGEFVEASALGQVVLERGKLEIEFIGRRSLGYRPGHDGLECGVVRGQRSGTEQPN